MRIPFDSLCLAAVAWELRAMVGGQVQRVVQPTQHQIRLTIFHYEHREQTWLLSCDPVFGRIHRISKGRVPAGAPSGFLDALRARVLNSTLVAVEQVGLDRILMLHFDGVAGRHSLIAEIMAKHSNLILVDGERVIAAAKVVGPGKSSRPIVPGGTYRLPPFELHPSFKSETPSQEEIASLSPFLKKWTEAGGDPDEAARAIRTGANNPVFSPGNGAYPVSVSCLGLDEETTSSFSEALERHFETAETTHALEQQRNHLLHALERVALAREVALDDLQQAIELADRANEFQLKGQLILAYGYGFLGQQAVEAYDYEGHHVLIPVDPDLSPPENAEKYFHKAKRAKARRGMVEDQLARLQDEKEELDSVISLTRGARLNSELDALQEQAKHRRWLAKAATAARKEDRPFEGHRVRELVGPNGYEVLYGEVATANDYLTQRVAKPDDWWLHVRGQPSAHVVIRTRKQPDRVPREVILYAAKVAVQNSPMKHSGYVDVDYTLRKYVRKPRGASPGFVTYTHEKTLTIQPE